MLRLLATTTSILIIWGAAHAAEPASPGEAAPTTAAAKKPAPAKLSIERFAAPPFMASPQLSPDGKNLAARLAIKGQQLLAVYPIYDKTAPLRLVNIGTDDAKIDVDWWQWVNDDWLLVGVSAGDTVEGFKVRVRRMVSLNRVTGKISALIPKAKGYDAATILWTATDGSPRALVAVQNSIYEGVDFWPEVVELDVSTGKTRTVMKARDNVRNYYADASGAVRLGYGYDDSKRTAKLLYRSSGKGSMAVLDRADYKKEETLDFPAIFLPGTDQAVTISNHDGHSALYELDLKTLTRGKKLFGIDRYDIDGIVTNKTGDGVVGVLVTEDFSRTHWLDADLAKVQTEIDKAVSPKRAAIVSTSRDLSILLVHVASASSAGAYYIYNRGSSDAMQRIGFVDETLKTQSLAPVRTVKYNARDGLEISAILTLPKDRPAKNLPVILLPHGGPHVRDSEDWDWWVQFLAWRGYAVIQPNYRGSTGFGKAFLKKGDGEWGLKMQDDLNDAITYLAAQGIGDPKRVCIAGASYGGYAALRGAQRDGKLFRCAISFAGVSDIAAIRRYDANFIDGNSSSDYWNKQTPNLAAVSPLKHAQEFSTPVLIIHGKADLRVPVDESRDMAAALKAAGKEYRYVEQPKGDHNFSREADRLQFLVEMQAWLDKYNPVDPR